MLSEAQATITTVYGTGTHTHTRTQVYKEKERKSEGEREREEVESVESSTQQFHSRVANAEFFCGRNQFLSYFLPIFFYFFFTSWFFFSYFSLFFALIAFFVVVVVAVGLLFNISARLTVRRCIPLQWFLPWFGQNENPSNVPRPTPHFPPLSIVYAVCSLFNCVARRIKLISSYTIWVSIASLKLQHATSCSNSNRYP